uniref:NADH-ubiquinone oxidoreductase chain 5 n=1 Tax=Tropiphorus elevatus TaxID=1342132 RepID=A0A343C496_9CUCU|nr:NADH dehydrogenase subunit 5 [Tropiphorus elevatus]
MTLSTFKIYFVLFLNLSINSFSLSLYFIVFDKFYFSEFVILSFNSITISVSILLDWMSLSFMSFVFFISALVINYSETYMQDDKNTNRFILLVVMFALSMTLLVISSNLVSILLGWDGLGFTSYALVTFYQNVKSSNAGMLTALSNRLGDAALLIGIACMLNYGSWSFGFYLDFNKMEKFTSFITFLMILAAFTKSAQMPFSPWLPAAMAAPTPVSSLVHSSTLVTAGVYLLIRFNSLFSPTVMNLLLFVSLITMFMAGLSACIEFDFKKIIALSTLSQLGLMISILALGEVDLAFFHLLIHALFKALLFLCAGMIIHNLYDFQDIRQMGALVKLMPLTCLLFNICNLSLCGLPFLSGFYSKDLMAEAMSMGAVSLSIYSIFYISVGLTAFYSFRLTYYTLIGTYNFMPLSSEDKEDKSMLKSMMWLVLLVIFMGSSMMWILFPIPYFICLPRFMKLLTLLMIFFGMWVGYEGSKLNLYYSLRSLEFFRMSKFLASMWNMSILFTFGVSSSIIRLGKTLLKRFDQGWTEYYGGQNLYKIMKKFTQFLQSLSKNHFTMFLLFFLLWMIFLTILIFY